MASSARAALAPKRETAKPRITPITHDYWEVLPSKIRGLAQYVAIGFIIRQTVGKERVPNTAPPLWAEITIAAFRKLFGEKGQVTTDREIEISLDDAVKRRLIAREKTGRGYRYRAVPHPCSFTIVNDEGAPEEVEFPGWAKAAPYKPFVVAVPPSPRPKSDPAEPSASAGHVSGPVLVERKTTAKRTPPPPPVVLQPGQSSDTIGLSPEVISLIYRNESPNPVRLSQRINGESLTIEICQHSNCSSGIPMRAADDNTRTAVRVSREGNVETKGDLRYEELRNYLDPKFLDLYHRAPDEPFVASLLRRLGPASVADFVTYAESELTFRPKPPRGLWLNWADEQARSAPVKEKVAQQHRLHEQQQNDASIRRNRDLELEITYDTFLETWGQTAFAALPSEQQIAFVNEARQQILRQDPVANRLTTEALNVAAQQYVCRRLQTSAPSFEAWIAEQAEGGHQ